MFYELFAKSNYSFLEGASHPEEIVQTAFERGYSGLALLDRNGVYGAPRAHVEAKKLGLPLVIGAEVCLESGQRAGLLARNRTGYGDLCELLTEVHDAEEPQPVKLQRLLEKSESLYVLVPAFPIREEGLEELRQALGDRLCFVASRFRDPQDGQRERAAVFLSGKYRARCIASQEPLFHDRLRKPLQDILTCVRHGCRLPEGGFRLLPNDERYLKPIPELERLFAAHPDWLENTVRVGQDCQFSLDEITYCYPVEWIPAGETGDGYLEKLVAEGLARRYPGEVTAAMRQQADRELALIRELGYSDFFLTVWDIVRFARSQGILCQGRGSAANSAVCFALGITELDPVRMNLLFERFISRERREPPDIDVDFEHERREEVIQYIYQRYGRHRAAITAEVICYRRRSALRDTAKVFDVPLSAVEGLLTLTHRQKLPVIPFERFAALAPGLTANRLRLYLASAEQLQGFPRHLGTHVGGFVLSQDALNRSVPIEKAAMPGRTIVQWDKNDLDALGFVRVDVLGLGILTCIRKCAALVKEHRQTDIDLGKLPEEAAIYDSLCAGDTVGLFQIESRAQMNMLPRLKPRMFYDLVVEISLVRPGPIQGQMVHPYLRRRAGLEKVAYPHPALRAILDKTFGVPLFQEQIMKMAMEVASFSGGEADEMRRAMGSWRRTGSLAGIGDRFRRGLMANGIPGEFAERVFQQIQGFAEYGFPESHAASFALLAYATAYLRFHYPDCYLAAILNSQPMGFYGKHTLIHDAERHGVKIRGIDVQVSDWDNQIEGNNQVRLGFREIKGLNQRLAQALLRARVASPFASFADLVARLQAALFPVALTRRDLFLLAGANALESVGLERRRALWEIQALALQDTADFAPAEKQQRLPRENAWEGVLLDYEAQGICLTQHPMQLLREAAQKAGILTSREVKATPAKRRVKIAGLVISRQMPATASGVLFITLEDELGFANAIIWNRVFEKFRTTLLEQSLLCCEGMVEKAEDGDVTHVIVDRASALLEVDGLRYTSHDFH